MKISQKIIPRKHYLNKNLDVRNNNYDIYGKNNYWEFTIPKIKDFDAKHYSPLIHEPIPPMERGTLEHDDFWDEQDRRCLEGYAPIVDGVQYPRITGPHYFYLNMVQIMMLKQGAKKKKLAHPYYRVLDHLIFLEIEKAEILGYGLIIGKARRMGLSYIGDCMTLWNLLFHMNNECAIGAGKEDKATDLFKKVIKSLDNLRPEYKVSYHKNKTELKLIYKVTENKVQKDEGIGSQLTVKTFFSDPSAFEGGSYSFFIFEEIGLQDNLIKSYKASEPCFMEGATQFGVPMMYGTGGEVDKGSRDMKIVYEAPDSYNMKRLFIPAYMYYPGNVEKGDSEMEAMDDNANFFDPRTGRTDEIKALEHILKRRQKASKSRDGYIKEIQSRPTEEGHLFLKTSGGLLNRIYLNDQLQKIYDTEIPYKKVQGRLEWDYDDSLNWKLQRCHTQKERDKLHMLNGSKVKFIEDDRGTVYKICDPINSSNMPYDADIGGIDSYDQQTDEDKGSMGASIIYRCFNGVTKDYNMPVAYIKEKGDASSDDTFYSNSLKLAIFYKCKMLVEYSKVAIINYFEDTLGHSFLKEKPILRNEAIANKGRQTYGVHMTTEMKLIVTKLLKHEVNLNCQNIWFDKILLDLIDYGDANTDLAMAFGMCLISKLDMFDEITDDIEDYDEGDVLMDMAYHTIDSNGNLVVRSYGQGSPGDSLETFDPRKHLTGEDRENYLNFMSQKKNMEKAEKQKMLKFRQQPQEDPFLSSIKAQIQKNKEQ